LIADLKSELNTHLATHPTAPCRLCLLRILQGTISTVTSFSLSKHTGGGDTTSAFSSQHVYLQFMWEVSLPLSPVEFSSHRHFYKLSCSWFLGVCRHSCLLGPACLFTAGLFIYSSREKWALPPLLWSFPPTTTFTSFSASGCWVVPGFLCSPAACLFTVLGGVAPSLSLQCSGCPALFATCVFCCCCLFFSFFFFPFMGLVCTGCCADLAQGCL
jgi:hypothetical protein